MVANVLTAAATSNAHFFLFEKAQIYQNLQREAELRKNLDYFVKMDEDLRKTGRIQEYHTLAQTPEFFRHAQEILETVVVELLEPLFVASGAGDADRGTFNSTVYRTVEFCMTRTPQQFFHVVLRLLNTNVHESVQKQKAKMRCQIAGCRTLLRLCSDFVNSSSEFLLQTHEDALFEFFTDPPLELVQNFCTFGIFIQDIFEAPVTSALRKRFRGPSAFSRAEMLFAILQEHVQQIRELVVAELTRLQRYLDLPESSAPAMVWAGLPGNLGQFQGAVAQIALPGCAAFGVSPKVAVVQNGGIHVPIVRFLHLVNVACCDLRQNCVNTLTLRRILLRVIAELRRLHMRARDAILLALEHGKLETFTRPDPPPPLNASKTAVAQSERVQPTLPLAPALMRDHAILLSYIGILREEKTTCLNNSSGHKSAKGQKLPTEIASRVRQIAPSLSFVSSKSLVQAATRVVKLVFAKAGRQNANLLDAANVLLQKMVTQKGFEREFFNCRHALERSKQIGEEALRRLKM